MPAAADDVEMTTPAAPINFWSKAIVLALLNDLGVMNVENFAMGKREPKDLTSGSESQYPQWRKLAYLDDPAQRNFFIQVTEERLLVV